MSVVHKIGLALGAALMVMCLGPGHVSAQSSKATLKDDLIGTWLLVSSAQTTPDGTKFEPYGTKPKGILTLDAHGNFAQIFLRDDLPKVDRRTDGTPEQRRAIVEGSLAIYGTYTVDEPTRTINMHYEASSFGLFNDTDAKRTITLKGDELTTLNYATGRFTAAEAKYRRAK